MVLCQTQLDKRACFYLTGDNVGELSRTFILPVFSRCLLAETSGTQNGTDLRNRP